MVRRVLRHAAIFLGFLLVAVVATWPLSREIDRAFTGAPSGDTGVYVWNVWVFQHELSAGRLPFYTSAIFSGTTDAQPANLSLHNYTTATNVLAWPLVPLVGLVAAFNIVFLFNIALAGYAAYLLARSLTGREWESLLAGVAFTLSPVLLARGTGHFSLVAAAPLPIFCLLLRKIGATGDVRYAFAAGAVVAWATCSDAYYGVFCLLFAAASLVTQFFSIERATDPPVVRIVGIRRMLDLMILAVGCFAGGIAVRGGGSLDVLGVHVQARTLYTPMLVLTVLVLARAAVAFRPRLSVRNHERKLDTGRAIAAGGLVVAVLLAPVLYAFGDQVISGNADLSPPLWRSSPRGIDLAALLLPNPMHALWAGEAEALLVEWTGRGDAVPEAVGSFSLVALAVMAGAWWRGGWRPSAIRVGFTVFFTLLALGPFLHVAGVNTHVPLPWSVLRYVPILGLVRSPGRFAVLAALCVAVLMAQALAHLGRRYPERRRQVLAVAAILLLVELVPGPRTLHSASVPALYQTIVRDPRPDVRVLELPVGLRDGTGSLGDFTARTQYFQTTHGKAIVGGYLSRVSPRRRRMVRQTPVLNAFVTLSERQPLTPEQDAAARGRADEFLRRTRLGYVVVDHSRATPALVEYATSLLGLTPIAEEGPLALYVPRVPAPPPR